MSNFKSIHILPSKNSIELNIWSVDSTHSIKMIKDVVQKTFDFMTSYLATHFPTDKLDIVLVPGTEMTTAESPGLIIIKSVQLN